MRSLSQLENRLQTDSVQPGSSGPWRPLHWCLGARRTLAGKKSPFASVANEDRRTILPDWGRERGSSELSIGKLGITCKWEEGQIGTCITTQHYSNRAWTDKISSVDDFILTHNHHLLRPPCVSVIFLPLSSCLCRFTMFNHAASAGQIQISRLCLNAFNPWIKTCVCLQPFISPHSRFFSLSFFKFILCSCMTTTPTEFSTSVFQGFIYSEAEWNMYADDALLVHHIVFLKSCALFIWPDVQCIVALFENFCITIENKILQVWTNCKCTAWC